MKADFKCGYVIITGKPNVGKSTLLNTLLGEKLSIVSSKPQTTRLAIKGFYNDADSQIIFLDTPGFLKPRYEMHKLMLKQITDTLKDADVVLFIIDFHDFPTAYDNELISLLKNVKRPIIAAVNKTDLKGMMSEAEILQYLENDFDRVIFISASNKINTDAIIPLLKSYMPYNPPFYDPEQLSDLPMRFFAQEIIREGIFKQFKEEIPYATAVIIDRYEELQDKIVIHATIWIERSSQKPIIIGSKGTGLSKIRVYAETECSNFNQKPTEIHLWVKIKANWRKNPSSLKELGFRY